MEINDRIQKIIDELYDGSRRKFAKSMGIPAMTIQNICGDRKTEPSFGIMQKIVNHHERIDPLWIMNGEGSMYITDTPKVQEAPPPHYGFDPAKILQGYISQQETIDRLSKDLEKAYAVIAEKQVIIDDLRLQNNYLNGDLRFKDAALKAKPTKPAIGGGMNKAG